MSHDFLFFSTFSRNVKCHHFKTVLKFFLVQIYHFEIAYYIYESFLAPYYYMLLMNKQENEFYAKPEDEFEQLLKTMSLTTIKKYAKVLISAKDYLCKQIKIK